MSHGHGVDNCSHRFCRNSRQLDLEESRYPPQIFQWNLLLTCHRFWVYVCPIGADGDDGDGDDGDGDDGDGDDGDGDDGDGDGGEDDGVGDGDHYSYKHMECVFFDCYLSEFCGRVAGWLIVASKNHKNSN